MATETLPEPQAPTQTRKLVEMNWDPITRIVGSLGIYTKIDFANRQVAECHSTSSIFRGYSVFMKGKDPRDAPWITSRICGICGDNHATCSVYGLNMALGIKTPPLGEWIINLGEAAEYMFDHNIFQDNLVGVDYCEQMVKETNLGMRILLGSSFYEDWDDKAMFVKNDPLGNPIDKRHPWNQTTTPKPQKRNFDKNYTWEEFTVPDDAIGCGFHEAVRGVLSHHVVIRDGKIANYHPYPPTPWNASPRDSYGTLGPYEDAVQNTPIFEENGPDKFKGVDIMRAVRSFDPCLPCGVHMYLGNGKELDVKHMPMFGAHK